MDPGIYVVRNRDILMVIATTLRLDSNLHRTQRWISILYLESYKNVHTLTTGSLFEMIFVKFFDFYF